MPQPPYVEKHIEAGKNHVVNATNNQTSNRNEDNYA